jgi:hypothetical protein
MTTRHMVIERSTLDVEDRLKAHQEDRQGLGLTRKRAEGARVSG